MGAARSGLGYGSTDLDHSSEQPAAGDPSSSGAGVAVAVSEDLEIAC